MTITVGAWRALLGGRKFSYIDKVLGYGPIAYWPMNEAAGAIAVEQINSPAQDGAYTGVTLGQAGIGDGETCPLFDGVNDYNNIYTATLAGVFSGVAGTIIAWFKVSGAGVWTDGSSRWIIRLRVDNNNYVNIFKSNVNNRITFQYVAGGTLKFYNYDGISSTGWGKAAITWDKNAGASGEVKCYIGGAQVSPTMTGLGVWAGVLDSSSTIIGAASTLPVGVWSGSLAHAALWASALGGAALADLATV